MDRVHILTLLRDHFNDSELRDLCFELDVEYENLAGTSKSDKARELVAYFQRVDAGGLPRLVAACRQQRPHLAWDSPSAGDTPAADRQRDERVYRELLGPMMVQFDRTREAFGRWRRQNLYLEAEIVRKGNLAILDLLTTKSELIPPDLMEEASQLVRHYDRWLEEFDRVRVSSPDPAIPFVFVGPKGSPFPRQAEQRFRARYEALREQLYGEK